MLRILHTADLHPRMNKQIAGGLHYGFTLDGMPLAFSDFKQSMEFLVMQAREYHVNLVLLAGDIFDVHNPTADEICVMMEAVNDLAAMAPVVVIFGNHDMPQRAGYYSPVEVFAGIENCDVVTSPQIFAIPAIDTCVCAVPYPSRANMASSPEYEGLSQEEMNATITSELNIQILKLLADCYEGMKKVFVGHGSCKGATIGEQPRSIEHDIFLNVDTLAKFDYAALGHIHEQQSLRPNVWYCGALLQQSFGESPKKGFLIAELHDDGRLDVLPIHNHYSRNYINIQIDGLASFFSVFDARAGQTRDCVYRLVGQIHEEDYDQLDVESYMQRLHDLPFFVNNLTIIKPGQVRQEGMAAAMTEHDAISAALDVLNYAEHSEAIQNLHNRIAAGETYETIESQP